MSDIRLSAAFRRLCVETRKGVVMGRLGCQPPSGGCVLKLFGAARLRFARRQPPSGGCVLKPPQRTENDKSRH